MEAVGASVQQAVGLVRAWIWFWYNDLTRVVLILMGVAPVALGLGLWHLGWLPLGAEREVLALLYAAFICWAVMDNDYSNLRRIGLDEYRRPLPFLNPPH